MDDLPSWRPATRLAFRGVFVFAALYVMPFPFSSFGEDFLSQRWEALWNAIAVFAGRNVFGITREIPVMQTGSGDRTVDWLRLFCVVVISTLAALIWTLVDRRRGAHPRLFAWTHLLLRYWLGLVLLGYGFAKVFEMQFPRPPAYMYLQSYGESSPMGLLWTFMGSSRPYSVFTGLSEVVAGSLLFVRRTATLGAIVAIGVLANVVMLNFSYDVPVKLYSSMLLLAAVFVLAPDLRRVANVFVLNRAAPPADVAPPLASRRGRRILVAAQVLIVAWGVYQGVGFVFAHPERSAVRALDGVYDVESPPEWRRVAFFGWGIRIFRPDGTSKIYGAEWDDAHQQVTLVDRQTGKRWLLSVRPTDAEHVVVDGILDDAPLRAVLERKDVSTFPLKSRGFHFINEVPFSR